MWRMYSSLSSPCQAGHLRRLDVLSRYEYTVALPAPSFMAQFNNLEDVDIVLNALVRFGFNDVFEVAKAAELVSAATRLLMKQNGTPGAAGNQFCLSRCGPADPGPISQFDPSDFASPRTGGGSGEISEGKGDERDGPSFGKDWDCIYFSMPRQGDGGKNAADH